MVGDRSTGRGAARGLGALAGAALAATAVLAVAQNATSKFDLRPPANAALVVLIGLAGLVGQRVTALVHKRQEQRQGEQLSEQALAQWPPLAAADANVFDLGVYPPVSGKPDPPYIERDIDGELATALETTAFVLVYGPTRSGKSRTALEVLGKTRRSARLLVPESAERLSKLIDVGPEQQVGDEGAVLWLDDLERFVEGLRINALAQLTSGSPRLQVLATLDEATLHALLTGTDKNSHTLRRFVARARLVALPGSLSTSELSRAAAIVEYSGLDFTGGFATAFSDAWDLPVTLAEPMTTAAHMPSPSTSPSLRASSILADRLIVVTAIAFLATLAWTIKISETEGLVKPASTAAQLVDLHRTLSSCGIELFSTDSPEAIDRGEPLVVATDPRMTCAARRSTAKPVLVYTLSHGRLKQHYAFGPPAELLPDHFVFECHGPTKTDRCWTDVTGEQTFAVIGGFRSSSASHLVFPISVSEVAGNFTARPLVDKRRSLTKIFRAAAYAKRYQLVGYKGAGYFVADFALVSAPSGDQDVGAVRLVAGFTPLHRTGARRSLQIRTQVLALDSGNPVLSTTRKCVPVNPHDREVVRVPTGRTFEVQLEKSWKRFERNVPARAICY